MSEEREPGDLPGELPAAPSPADAAPVGKRESELAREPNAARRFLKLLGPGLITGAADDDPTGIAVYTQAGAQFGLSTIWTALFTFPLMAAVQFTCAKIGLASDMGLATVLRRHYSRFLLYPAIAALVAANTINSAANIGAIAAGINLLVPVPVAALIVPVSLAIAALLVWGSYRLIANTFKWLTLALFAYVGASLLARPEWSDVLKNTLIPTISAEPAFLATLVAILGTNISPYLFFWQASQEVEEQRTVRRRRALWRPGAATDAELKYAAWDVNIGMLFSNLVIYFVNVAAASTLFKAGLTNIQTAADAAAALRPIAGDAAGILFAVGLIGAGMLGVPVLTAASAYAVTEAFGWRRGLDANPIHAKEFYWVIAVSMLVAVEMNFLGINPISALFWSAVLNGVVAPPLLVLIILIANNRAVMGSRVNGWALNLLCGLAACAMIAAAVGLFLTWGK